MLHLSHRAATKAIDVTPWLTQPDNRLSPLRIDPAICGALGWQRQFKRVNAQTGKTRFELAKVKPDSWLGKNYLYLQFGLLYVGLCARIRVRLP